MSSHSSSKPSFNLPHRPSRMDVWTCCQCGAANLKWNAPDRCPTCTHYRCSQCQWGPPAFTNRRSGAGRPGTTTNSHTSQAPAKSASQLSRMPSRVPPFTPSSPMKPSQSSTLVSNAGSPFKSSYPLDQGSGRGMIALPARSSNARGQAYPSTRQNNPSSSLKPSARPSMAGWWYCCRCNHLNNPALCGGRCTVCGHGKDDYCRPA